MPIACVTELQLQN